MPSKKVRLHQVKSLKMHSRDHLTRLRETRLKAMGVNSYPALLSIPVLLGLILLTGWLRTPQTAEESFRPIEDAYLNPMAGWAIPAADWGKDDRMDVSLVYAEVTWAELEPEDGQFDFESFEKRNHLNEWWAAGKRLILRFVTDRPGEPGHKDIPDWLIKEMGGEILAGSFYETASGGGFAPDYSSLVMREAHRKAILALAERYNEHPGVAYIELGSLGWNGEWTIDLSDENAGKLPTSTISREYAWHYTSAFTNTLMLMRRPYLETELMEVGLYNPMLGDFEATWDYLETVESGGYDHQIETDLIAMPDAYLISPAGAHISDALDLEALLEDSAPELARQITESRVNYVVLHEDLTGLSDTAVGTLQELDALIGYRLWLRSAEWDCRLRAGIRSRVLLCFRNDGAVPMHDSWPVELALFDGEKLIHRQQTALDTSMLLPGDTDLTAYIDLPYQMKPGTYTLKLAIIDPATNLPGIRLANEESDAQTLWMTLGELCVK